MQVSSEIQSAFRCTVRSFRDSAVLCGDRSEAARLVFPATGALIVSGEHGNWVVSSSRALWLAPNARHDIARTSVVSGKSVSVRVETGGRRSIKKKKTNN